MTPTRDALFRRIDGNLDQLRAAILAGDIDLVERSTAELSNSLSALQQVLLQDPPSHADQDWNSLRSSIRAARSLLASARQTVRALTSVYLSFSPPEQSRSPEVL